MNREQEGIAGREQGIRRAAAGVSEEWKATALSIVLLIARHKLHFTADDVWDAGMRKPVEPRALGAVMRRAQRTGAIIPTGTFVPSVQPTQHRRPIRVWQSTVIKEKS